MTPPLVQQLFATCVQLNSSQIALDFEGSTTVTYSELDSLSTALASELRVRGVKPETMVPLMFNASVEMIIAILAVVKSGGAYIPLDAEHPRARLEKILGMTNAKIILYGKEKSISTRIAEMQESKPDLIAFQYHHGDTAIEASNLQPLPPLTIEPHSLAYVFFTSGSTGTPKGVAVEHRNLAAVLNSGQGNAARRLNMRRLLVSPYTFDCSVGDIFSTLTTGGILGLVERRKLLSNLPHWVEVMKPTHIAVTPTIARQIPADGLPHLQHLLLAGETLPVDLALKVSRNRTVMNIMGPTECTVDVVEYVIPKGSLPALGLRVPVGRPGKDVLLYLLGPGTNEHVPIGEAGEICIGGPQVARGYLDDPELSRAKFVPDPFSAVPGARMFRTADLGVWNSDGELEHLGRLDGQVKLRGLRIETGEIETVVGQCDVRIAGVYVDVLDVRGEQTLVAVLELPATGPASEPIVVAEITETAVVERAKIACKTYLPGYMMPSIWLCATRFPQSSTGKLGRSKIRAAAEEYIATRLTLNLRAAARRAQTEEERLIVRAVSHILDIEPEEVVLDASFIQHGGNSLQAMMVTTALHSHGIGATIAECVDDARTLAMLAVRDRSVDPVIQCEKEEYTVFSLAPRGWEQAVKSAGLQLDEVEDVYPIQTVTQDWWRRALKNEGRAMIIEYTYESGSDIDATRFTWAWEQLRLREPSLRTVLVENRPDPAEGPMLPRGDFAAVVLKATTPSRGAKLDVLSAPNAEATQALLTTVLAEHRVESGRVPIRSWLVLNEADRKWLFVTSRHHALHDARTLDMLGVELSDLYHRGEAAFASIEATKTVANSFGAFMHSIARPCIVSKQRAFWRQYLEGIGPALWPSPSDVPWTFCKDLPTKFALIADQWMGSLQEISKAMGVTKGALLRGAFGMAVAEREGRSETLVFEPTNGMADKSLTPHGFCLDFKPTRIQSHPEVESETERFIAVARDAHKSTAETLSNLGWGYDMAVDVLGPQVDSKNAFLTSFFNVFDVPPQAKTDNLLPGTFLQKAVGLHLPLYVEARITHDRVSWGCFYDPTVVVKEDAEVFIQRQKDFLTCLWAIDK
ncbi:hypothetical protein C8R43DRAFT_414664 [Mycena crocata]|nr:hypothetical protein C8R43DRAFT_414664 [Mycena crocata]